MKKREVAIYLLVAFSSLFVISYVVHMFIGGLVDADMENRITIGVVALWALVLTGLGIDIARKRRRR